MKMFSFLPALILAGVALPQATQGISSHLHPEQSSHHRSAASLLSGNYFLVSTSPQITLPFPCPDQGRQVIVDINCRPLTKLDFTDLCSNYSLSGLWRSNQAIGQLPAEVLSANVQKVDPVFFVHLLAIMQRGLHSKAYGGMRRSGFGRASWRICRAHPRPVPLLSDPTHHPPPLAPPPPT